MKKRIICVMVLIFLLGAVLPGFAQDFNTSDLEGDWYYFVTEVNPALSGVYWLTGTGEVDASGNMAGVYVAPDGSAVAITSGEMVVARNGSIKGTLLAETGDTVTLVDGKLDQSKTFGTAVLLGSDGTMDITTMIKGGGTFMPADMEGQWYAYVTAIDPATTAVYWVYGTIDVDNSGNVTGTFNAPNGSTVSVTGGMLSSDGNGVITGSTTLSTGDTATIVQGKLDQGKTFGAYVSIGEDQSMRIGYLHKAGGTFVPGEGAGYWYAYGLGIVPSIPAVYWSYGRGDFGVSGNLNGFLKTPTAEIIRVTGTNALNSAGVWTGSLAFSNGDMGITSSAKLNLNRSNLTGVSLNASGSMAVWQFIKGSPYLYFPHIASDGVWETEIGMINDRDTTTINGDLVAYSNTGEEVSRINVSLMPHGRRSIIIGNEFSNPDQIGYLVFQSDEYVPKGYTKFYIDGKYRVAVPAVSTINMEKIYISHIASDHEWWTGVSLLNTNAEAKQIDIEFNTGVTVSRTLAAFEHQAFLIRDLFNGTTPQGIESAVIRNADGIVGLELFGSQEGKGNMLSGILLKDDTSMEINYPHVAENDWWTGIVAYNPSDTQCTLTITPFSENGASLTPQTRSLAGHEKYIGVVGNLNFPAETAWFKIDASSPITGFELFGTTNGNQLAGYTGVGISGTDRVFAKIEKDGWTGIAFVNLGAATANIWLTAYDDNGTQITMEPIALASHAKIVGIADNLFSNDISAATYITYSSDHEVVGFQLNGSSDNMMLDGLPGM